MSTTPRSLRQIEAAAMRLYSRHGAQAVTIQQLAREAGVARGTVYAHVDDLDALFVRVASRLADEMHDRVIASLEEVRDPAELLSHEIRLFIRRAHEEPDWGRFVYRFGLDETNLRRLFHGVPARATRQGIEAGRYPLRSDQIPGMVAMIAGCTLSGIFMVLEGQQTWRQAGSGLTELLLRAAGLDADEAHRVANLPLPDLLPADATDKK